MHPLAVAPWSHRPRAFDNERKTGAMCPEEPESNLVANSNNFSGDDLFGTLAVTPKSPTSELGLPSPTLSGVPSGGTFSGPSTFSSAHSPITLGELSDLSVHPL